MIYWELFITFLEIGAFTFGGGYAMLPLIQQEVVKHGWMSQEELIDFIAISESTPGPFAVNASTFVGTRTAGILGAVCATLGIVLPSFVIILLIAKIFDQFQKSTVVGGAMIGLKGMVVGMIASAIITTGISVFTPMIKGEDVKEIILALVLLSGVLFGLKKKVQPILLILLAALFGIVLK